MKHVMQPRSVGRRSLFAVLGGVTITAVAEQARADAATIGIGYSHYSTGPHAMRASPAANSATAFRQRWP
jgi:hypothetical protein